MQSTLTHSLQTLATFGVDIEPERCDTDSLRMDAEDIYNGVCPLHMESCPPRFAADLMVTVANILDETL